MYCPQCGCENNERRKLCWSCGTELKLAEATETPKAESEPVIEVQCEDYDPQPSILSRSASNRAAAGAWRSSVRKVASRLQRLGLAPVIFLLGFRVLSAWIDDIQMEIAAERLFVSPWTWIILLGLLIFVLVATNRMIRQADEQVAPYFACCAAEYLIVDTQKIYGSTRTGNITLRYNQIRNVQCLASEISVSNQNAEAFTYYRLCITDIADNRFELISFSNARELCTLIDSRIPRRRTT